MKKLLIILFTILSVGLSSCKDIINSDPNRVVLIDSSALGWQDYLEFRFSSDFLTYTKNDTTILWDIKLPSKFARPFNVVNNYRDSLMTINSIRLLDGRYFQIIHNVTFPVVLLPGEVGTKNNFFIILDTYSLPPGTYYDKIIINEDKNSGLYVRVYVYNN